MTEEEKKEHAREVDRTIRGLPEGELFVVRYALAGPRRFQHVWLRTDQFLSGAVCIFGFAGEYLGDKVITGGTTWGSAARVVRLTEEEQRSVQTFRTLKVNIPIQELEGVEL